jgi:Homeodomain-like domain
MLSAQEKFLVTKACRAGGTIEQVAKRFAISPSTVDRVLREKRDEGEEITLRRGRPLQTNIDQLYRELRAVPFPYPAKLSVEMQTLEIAKLRSNPLTLVDGEIRPRSYFGTKLCAPFFPNRFEARWKNGISAFDAWHDEASLRNAITFQIRQNDPVLPHRVLRAITLICRTPTIFRPAVARFIYQRYCPAGGLTWDPCAGYGGRLLGAHVAGIRYLGTDVDQQTVLGNRELAIEIKSKTAEIVLSPAETFEPPKIDLAFTSPPYFTREKYSAAALQSWQRYGHSLDGWIEGFLRPVIDRCTRALKPGGYLVLNVADLKERGHVLPIVSRACAVARDSDLVHVETLLMPLAAINRKAPTEPVLAFQKPF